MSSELGYMLAALFMFLTWTQQEMVKWHVTMGNNLFGLGEASAWVEVEAGKYNRLECWEVKGG